VSLPSGMCVLISHGKGSQSYGVRQRSQRRSGWKLHRQVSWWCLQRFPISERASPAVGEAFTHRSGGCAPTSTGTKGRGRSPLPVGLPG